MQWHAPCTKRGCCNCFLVCFYPMHFNATTLMYILVRIYPIIVVNRYKKVQTVKLSCYAQNAIQQPLMHRWYYNWASHYHGKLNMNNIHVDILPDWHHLAFFSMFTSFLIQSNFTVQMVIFKQYVIKSTFSNNFYSKPEWHYNVYSVLFIYRDVILS